jgi:leucyl-tRNA synthetase
MKSLGISVDWSREIDTSDPKYYKWTQWIFLQLFKKSLAYKARMEINWCPKDKIGLANEEVIDGKCERCGTEVEKREKEQWMLAITKYADRLDKDLDTVNYLPQIKIQQRNWIGKSEGAEIEFEISHPTPALPQGEGLGGVVRVFTTRPDTLFGATYLVLAPEHQFVQEQIRNSKSEITNKPEIEKYLEKVKKKTEIERTTWTKDPSIGSGQAKTGVEIKGIKAINPATGEEIPIWVADYVLSNYGTGAVMAVPAHDERDFQFARKYNLPIKQVIAPFATAIPGEPDEIRPDKKTVKRKTAYMLLWNKKENKFLCLDWEKYGWHSGIIGGVDEGESYEDAARREIKEETGYMNIKFVRELGGEQHNHFFAAHKDENRYGFGRGMLFEIVDDKTEPVSNEHTKNHKPIWIKAEEMENWLNLSAFKYMWRMYKSDTESFVGEGVVINSDEFDGLKSEEVREKIAEKFGKKVIRYKLRDWVFSRQRYWGEPIPLVNCEKCGWVAVPEKDLPVKLPEIENYKPTDTGESPLSNITEWVNTKCPQCGGDAKRETDVMPNWAGSSWYYLRYIDPHNDQEFADQKKLKYWTPVDWYNGGMEHTTLHLLYSRFWHKFLFDIGVVPTNEPYAKRTSHGLILAKGGEKMSKSKGNVVNPDDVVAVWGADSLRLYEMFMGPFADAIAWDTDNMIGVRRFLERMWKIGLELKAKSLESKTQGENLATSVSHLETSLHKTIKKVTEDIEGFKFNTAISAMMIFMNELEKEGEVSRTRLDIFETFLLLLAPFAPHITEELWQTLGHQTSIHLEKWPEFDESKIKEQKVTIVVQVNGKIRGQFEAPIGVSEEEAKEKAFALEDVKKWIVGQEIKKVVFVPNKLVSLVF